MAKRGLITGGGGDGVDSYIDLENRPDDVIDTTVVPAGTTGGDFTPENDNSNKAAVSITDDGKTITTTRTNNAWGGSGTFSTESIDGDGYVSFKLTQTGKRFMFGLSKASEASSTTYSTIDYAIYITGTSIQVYEDSANKGSYASSFTNGATYKVKRTGNIITYLVNDVVFYTSETTTSVPLHMDTAFLNTSSRLEEVTMLNAPLTPVARTATYKIDYNNVNLINKPDIHVNVLVSDTNFATIALALADDAVKTAHAGDFVKIAGGFYHVIKTNPRVADDLLKGSGIDLPPVITDNQVTTGVGTEPVLVTPTKAKAMIKAHSTGHTPVIVSATDFSTVALALANDAVKNATAGDFVKISGDIYVVVKTSPTVSADLVDINGEPDLSALATKAELSSGLSEKLNLDTYLLAQSLPGVPVTDGIEMAYFPKLPLTELTDAGKVSATSDPKNGRRLIQADVAKQPTFLLNKKDRYYYDIGLEQSLISEGNIAAGSLGGVTGKTTSFMFVFTPNAYINNTQFMWGTATSSKRLSVHLMRDSAGRMVIDHGSNLGGRYSLTTSTLVAGKVNSLLFVRNDNVAEVWINGVSQGSQTIGNSLPTDATALPFSIGVMVGNDNYKSALGFNALFFYGRALTVHERTLMIAYSKKEYESIDPVELPPEITDAQVTSGTGTDEVLPTPAKLKTMIQAHSSGGGGTLPPEITNAQVTSGVGTSTVLMTPSKNKAMIIAHAPSGGGTTLPPEITNSQVNSGVGTTTVLVTPAKNKAMIEAHSTNVELPAQVSTAEKTARTETALRSWSVKDVADMDIGGGTATTVPWAGITSKPPLFKEEPLSSDPDFDNTYKGGISIDTNGGITLTCTSAGWGNSGAWNDTPIPNNGSISAKPNSIQSQTEMMFGMSYKNSETKPQDKSFGQINFTWYFRKSDGMAFIRETDSSGQNNRNIPGYTALPTDNTKVYSIVKVGVVAQYHIDGVLVHTSLLEAVDNMYYDVAFSTIGGSLTDMKIVYDSGVKTTEIKYEYIDGAPVIPAEIPEITDEQISSGTQTTLVAFTPQKAKTMIETHANTGETQFADLEGVPSILEPRTRTNTFSTPINQWASGVSASSVRNATGGYSPSMAIGAPDTGLAVGADCAGNLKAYAEAQADRDKINTLTLTYTTPVYLSTVTIRETQGSGYVSKLDVKRDGVFVNVFERNIQTKANISGGTMTGSNERKVSDALITLTNQLTYKVSEIRIHLGGFISGVSLLNEIDAVKMTGSETLTQSAYEVDISYLNLKDKPAPTPTPAPETWYGLGEKPPAFKITNATPTLNQWATGATASSSYAASGGYSAGKMIGQPDTGLSVGSNGADNGNAWAQANADKTKVINVTLTYATSVHISVVTVRETFNAGTISKLEVDKNGTFTTVYTRNLASGAETGGVKTGDTDRGRVSDSKITLTNTLNWRSNKIRITLGNAVDQYNEIDAVKLTSPPEVQNTQIDYNYVINKPTSSTVHSIETSTGVHLSMDLEGNTPVEITALRTKIKPKFPHSSLSISANIMACAQIGHIFSFSIHINGAPYTPSTPSEKHIDALVPVPTRGADESLLNSIFGEIKASHGNNTDEVTVGVFVYYHKDVDATERTANLSINRARITIKGVASTLAGTSTLKVTEID